LGKKNAPLRECGGKKFVEMRLDGFEKAPREIQKKREKKNERGGNFTRPRLFEANHGKPKGETSKGKKKKKKGLVPIAGPP